MLHSLHSNYPYFIEKISCTWLLLCTEIISCNDLNGLKTLYCRIPVLCRGCSRLSIIPSFCESSFIVQFFIEHTPKKQKSLLPLAIVSFLNIESLIEHNWDCTPEVENTII